MVFGDRSWEKGIVVRIFFIPVYFLMVSHAFAQVVVDGNTNNIAVQEIRLNVDGNVHLQTTDLVSRYNPAPDNVPVLIETILLQNGTEIFATTRTPEIQNLHPYLGTNTIGENTVGVAKYDGTYVNHQNAGFANALEEVVSTPDLRSYWDINSNAIPSGEVFMDIMYPIEVPKSGYLVVSERDGNSDFDFQALDIAGNPITGAETIALRGYDWNTEIVNQGNYPTQPQHLVVISPTLFNTEEPIYGFRVININGADGKIVFFRNSIHVVEDIAEPSYAGETNVINVLANDELKEQAATVDNVNIIVSEPEPNGYLTLNADGSVDIATEAPPGSYVIKYSICEKGNNTNCAEGIVNIEVMFALPVTWIDFHAFEENDGFRIRWRTAKENNNKKYQIWRTTSQDLKEFEIVGELPGIGESSSPTKYSFLDTVPCHQESVYYRIVQWDQDGNYSSSDIFKLKRKEKNSRNMHIFPNPYSDGELQISLTPEILQKNGLVSVQDNSGQYLFYSEGKIKHWVDLIPSRLKDLPVGLYFVMIQTKEEKSLVKWIKK